MILSSPWFRSNQTPPPLKVIRRSLVPWKKGPRPSGGEKQSGLRCEIKLKALSTAFSRQDGDAVKHLTESVAPAWWQTLQFHSEANIQQCGARVSFLSFSFEWPQGGQEDKDDRMSLAALRKESVPSPDTVIIKVLGWLLMAITSRMPPRKTTVLRSAFCSYRPIGCLGVVRRQLHCLSIRRERLRVLR